MLAMSQKYNLRSGKREAVLPVQLQLCDDQDFVSQMLGSSYPTPVQLILSPAVILNVRI